MHVATDETYVKSLFNLKRKINWPFVEMHIPGRTPKCCLDNYNQLRENNLINDIEKQCGDLTPIEKINKMLKKAFLPSQESYFFNEIFKKLKMVRWSQQKLFRC